MPYSVRAILGRSDDTMRMGAICWVVDSPDLQDLTVKVVGKNKGGRNMTRILPLADFSRFVAWPFHKLSDDRLIFRIKADAQALAEGLERARPAPTHVIRLTNHDAEWLRRVPAGPKGDDLASAPPSLASQS